MNPGDNPLASILGLSALPALTQGVPAMVPGAGVPEAPQRGRLDTYRIAPGPSGRGTVFMCFSAQASLRSGQVVDVRCVTALACIGCGRLLGDVSEYRFCQCGCAGAVCPAHLQECRRCGRGLAPGHGVYAEDGARQPWCAECARAVWGA